MYGYYREREDVIVTVRAEVLAPVPESIKESDLGYDMDYDKVTKEICEYNGFGVEALDDIGDSLEDGRISLVFYVEIGAPGDDPLEHALNVDILHDYFVDSGFTEQGAKYLIDHAEIDGEV